MKATRFGYPLIALGLVLAPAAAWAAGTSGCEVSTDLRSAIKQYKANQGG